MFKSGPSPHRTAVAMIGAKPGQTVVVVTAGAPALVGEIARVTGLNGRTLATGLTAASAPSLEAAAADAGALVEILPPAPDTLAVPDGAADIVVLDNVLTRVGAPGHLVAETHRVLRLGGRAIAIEGEAPRGLLSWGRRAADSRVAGDAARAAMDGARFKGTRVLGKSDGVTYVEGVK